jgi:glyoxylate carboligase
MPETASDLLLERLIHRGIDTIFGLPGDGIDGLWEALRSRRRRWARRQSARDAARAGRHRAEGISAAVATALRSATIFRLPTRFTKQSPAQGRSGAGGRCDG